MIDVSRITPGEEDDESASAEADESTGETDENPS